MKRCLPWAGTIGAERASGISPITLSEGAIRVVSTMSSRQLKEIFDPEGILNPQKVVGAERGEPRSDLRPTVSVGADAGADRPGSGGAARLARTAAQLGSGPGERGGRPLQHVRRLPKPSPGRTNVPPVSCEPVGRGLRPRAQGQSRPCRVDRRPRIGEASQGRRSSRLRICASIVTSVRRSVRPESTFRNSCWRERARTLPPTG